MFPKNTMTASEEVLQTIHPKYKADKSRLPNICSFSKAQLLCFKFCNCRGSMCYNTWTTLDENSVGGDDSGVVEETDDDGSADEQ